MDSSPQGLGFKVAGCWTGEGRKKEGQLATSEPLATRPYSDHILQS